MGLRRPDRGPPQPLSVVNRGEIVNLMAARMVTAAGSASARSRARIVAEAKPSGTSPTEAW